MLDIKQVCVLANLLVHGIDVDEGRHVIRRQAGQPPGIFMEDGDSACPDGQFSFVQAVEP
jgi:hypothetical protein